MLARDRSRTQRARGARHPHARRGAPALRHALPRSTAPPRIAPLTPAPVPAQERRRHDGGRTFRAEDQLLHRRAPGGHLGGADGLAVDGRGADRARLLHVPRVRRAGAVPPRQGRGGRRRAGVAAGGQAARHLPLVAARREGDVPAAAEGVARRRERREQLAPAGHRRHRLLRGGRLQERARRDPPVVAARLHGARRAHLPRDAAPRPREEAAGPPPGGRRRRHPHEARRRVGRSLGGERQGAGASYPPVAPTPLALAPPLARSPR